MARRPSLQQDIEQIAALRALDDEDDLRERLRRALGDRRPMIAGRAARVAAERSLAELVPEIGAALDRLLGAEDEDTGLPADPSGLSASLEVAGSRAPRTDPSFIGPSQVSARNSPTILSGWRWRSAGPRSWNLSIAWETMPTERCGLAGCRVC